MDSINTRFLRFTDELYRQFPKLDMHLVIEILKLHSLFYALEQKQYQELGTNLSKDSLMKCSPDEVDKTIKGMYQKLCEYVPTMSSVFLGDSFKAIDQNTLYKLLVLLGRHGLTKDEYSDQKHVITFFHKVIDEFVLNTRTGYIVTPNGLTELMIRSIEPNKGTVYDPTAGIANLIVSAYLYANSQNKNVRVYGQEIDKNLFIIGKLNLFLHDILPVHGDIQLGDVIREPKWLENNRLMQFDYVLMNFPFGHADWGYEIASNDPYGRFDLYGLPPKTRGDFAFILHALASLKSNGKAAIVVPLGILFRGAQEKIIRSNLVKDDVIESIVALPDNLFIGTGIQVALLILNKNKPKEKQGKILMVNAENDFKRTRTQKFLEEEHILRITDALSQYKNLEQFSIVVSIQEIAENDFNLKPTLYFEKTELNTEFGTIVFNKQVFERDTENLVRIGDIAEVIRGVNLPGRRQIENVEGDIYPIIQIRDIENGVIQFENIDHFPVQTRDLERVTAKPGDILVSSRGTQQKVAVVPEYKGIVLVSSMFVILRIRNHLKQKVNPFYIKRFLESPVGRYYLELNQSGTAVTVLTPNDIKSIPIPLISIEKQNEIVKQLDDADDLILRAMEMRNKQYLNAYGKIGFDLYIRSKEKE